VKQDFERVDVPHETLQRARVIFNENEKGLEAYLDLLLDWNEKINLVSRAVSRETVREHIVHSLLPMAIGLTQKHTSGWTPVRVGACREFRWRYAKAAIVSGG